MSTQLSKSEYLMFLKHPAWLWLKKHDKAKLPPVDDNTQAMFDAGNLFESYAEQLFPDGVKIGFSDYQSYLTLPERTSKALAQGSTTLFQGRLEHESITCIFDVITVVGEKTIDLYEIKSSTEVKPEHKLDLAFQAAVFEGVGYQVRKVFVIHVNNQYVREGNVDVSQITTVSDVSEAVKELQEQTQHNIVEALSVANAPIRPDISPSLANLGSFKEWLEIYKGLTKVEPGSIYELANPGATKIGQLESLGIKRLVDIPASFSLSDTQALQVKATKEQRVLVEPEKIKAFLGTFVYPLYFFDYETMSGVIPAFNGMRPYQQVPFQYSLHILDAPGAELRHAAYLHRDNSNPAQPLSEALRAHIGTTGTVLVWYASFEKGRNATLGSLVPEFKDFYQRLNDRIVDLMDPFSNGWYVDPNFRGSASIKQVLPVLAPELSYKTLGIQEGGAAQRLWMEAVLDGKRPNERDQVLADLDEYCALDTLAMVRIYEKLVALKPTKALMPIQATLL